MRYFMLIMLATTLLSGCVMRPLSPHQRDEYNRMAERQAWRNAERASHEHHHRHHW